MHLHSSKVLRERERERESKRERVVAVRERVFELLPASMSFPIDFPGFLLP